jgi:hypothetical protein
MNEFTPQEQAIIDAQGWNSDSLVTILSSRPNNVTLLDWLQSWADEENGVGDDWD